MKRHLMSFGRSLCRIVFFTGAVASVLLAIIKICLLFAFTEPEKELIVQCVPLLSRMVWPMFILLLVFLFYNHVLRILIEIPGMINRSCFPHSERAADFNTSPADETDKSLSISADDGCVTNTFSERDHQKKVREVICKLSVLRGAIIHENRRLPGTRLKCDGEFESGGVRYFVAVLPVSLRNRVKFVIERVDCFASYISVRDMSKFKLLICLYDVGIGDLQIVELEDARNQKKFGYEIEFEVFYKSRTQDSANGQRLC